VPSALLLTALSLCLCHACSRVLLLEHGRASFAPLAAYQDATAGAVAAAGKGCAWNQDVLALLPAAGLRVRATTPTLGGLLRTIEAVAA
jgi:methyltransferase OMS1